jgi:hypothetical protein
MPARSHLAILLLLGALPVGAPSARAQVAPAGPDWSWDAAVGYDSFTHTYALADADTSETVSELRVQLGWEGRSAPGSRRAWRLRVEGSAGSDLFRERLEADWRGVDHGGVTRVRAGVRVHGLQYRGVTDDSGSSDQLEGRLDGQAVPLARDGGELFVQGWAASTAFARSSPLEQDLREVGLGAGVRSRGLGDATWLLAIRNAARTYPDSTVIDRRSWSVEADAARALGEGGSARLYLRSEHRLAAETTVRPDAWLHWLDAAGHLPAAGGELVLEAQAERWDYGSTTDAYQDSWRLAGLAGVRCGDVLSLQWLLGLAAERFDTGESSESYTQAGLRAGLEAFGSRLSGSCTVEYGRRDHREPTSGEEWTTWTDFNYWRLWLLADYRVAADLSLSVLGSWEPERHAEPADDVSLGFASLRLVWRP